MILNLFSYKQYFVNNVVNKIQIWLFFVEEPNALWLDLRLISL